MRYFFGTDGRCKQIITENPRNYDISEAAVGLNYKNDGNVGRDTNNAFRDSLGILRGRNSISISAQSSPGPNTVRFSVSAAWYPVYLYLTGYNSSYSQVTKGLTFSAAGTYSDGGWYQNVNISVYPNSTWGDGNTASCFSCECNCACDC